jgi:hypothetical protein
MPAGEFRYCRDPEAAWLASGNSMPASTDPATRFFTWSAAGSGVICTTGNTASGTVIVYSPDGSAGLWYGTFPSGPGSGLPQAQIEQLVAEHQREAEKAAARRQVADARAHQLLLSLLDEIQAADYAQHGWFELRGSAGGWWRIRGAGQAGNVDELEASGGERIASWCCHPPGALPDADAYIAQMLHLAADEPGFRAAGNRTGRRQPAAA